VIIQIVLVPALVLAVVLSLRSRASLRGQARRKILAALTVVAGVVAVLFPVTLQALADATGVTRGTDLLLYVLALVIIYLVGSTSVRFREQEARIVLLARQVALSDAALRHVEALQARSEQAADQLPVAVHRGVQQRPARG
jgi:small membrane protein